VIKTVLAAIGRASAQAHTCNAAMPCKKEQQLYTAACQTAPSHLQQHITYQISQSHKSKQTYNNLGKPLQGGGTCTSSRQHHLTQTACLRAQATPPASAPLLQLQCPATATTAASLVVLKPLAAHLVVGSGDADVLHGSFSPCFVLHNQKQMNGSECK